MPAHPRIPESEWTGTTQALRDPRVHLQQIVWSLPVHFGKEASSGEREGAVLCRAIWPRGRRTATSLFYLIVKAWSLVPLRRWHNTSCIVQHPLIKHPIAQPCIAMEFFAAHLHCWAQRTFPHMLQQTLHTRINAQGWTRVHFSPMLLFIKKTQ